MYEEEKHLRTLQLEAIRFLWKEVQITDYINPSRLSL